MVGGVRFPWDRFCIVVGSFIHSLSPLPSPLSPLPSPPHRLTPPHQNLDISHPRNHHSSKTQPLTHESNPPSSQTTTRSSRYDETAFRYLLHISIKPSLFFSLFPLVHFPRRGVYISVFQEILERKDFFCNLLLFHFFGWERGLFTVRGFRRSETLGILSFVSGNGKRLYIAISDCDASHSRSREKVTIRLPVGGVLRH